METGPVLILTALDFEARPIARRLGLGRVGKTEHAGEVAGVGPVRLRVVGPLARCRPEHAEEGCRLVLLAGLAGGLAPDLRRGDVVLDERSARGWGLAKGSARLGRVETVASVVATPAEKAALHAATGAAVADMESAVVRRWARRQGVAYVGLRAVSDAADEPLDPATLRLVNAGGFLSPWRVAREVVRRPAFAMTLWRMRDSGRVMERLADAVAELLRGGDRYAVRC